MKLRCRLFGHDFKTLAIDGDRASIRGHLSTMAGVLAQCRRCNYVWDDLSDFARRAYARDSKKGGGA